MAPGAGYTHSDAFDEGFLQVSDLHRIKYYQYGKKDGKPIVFLHGGPGGSCKKSNTAFFDPAVYHVVLFDQRGAGLSEPSSETRDNTTQLLIQDIEQLREHVGVKKWHVVFGGSWGSTLALAYAQAHPEVCGSLVLRGVFLGTKAEVALTTFLVSAIWPEQHDQYIDYLPEDKREDHLQAYHDLIMSEDRDIAYPAAKAWGRLELSVSALSGAAVDVDEYLNDEKWAMAHSKLETHYFVNGSFFEEDQLLNGCEKIKDIPVRIAQGRYDIVCPPRSASEVYKRLSNAKIYYSQAGHAVTESDTFGKLIEFCDELGHLDL